MAHNRAEAHEDTMRVDMPDDMDTPANLSRKRTKFLEDGLDTGVKIQRTSWAGGARPQISHKSPKERLLTFMNQEDGRLDINIQEHRPKLAKLLDHFHRERKASEPSKVSEPPAEPVHEKPKPKPFPLRMNIVIHVVGSRGDVQPFVALGKELKKHGHRVRLATHLAFEDFVCDSGLEFFNIGGDPEEMMAFMVRNPGLLPDFQTIKSGSIQRHRECVRDMVCGCWRSCFEPGDGTGPKYLFDDVHSYIDDQQLPRPFVADAIIANPPSFAHVHCAEKLGIPLNMMFT